MSPKEAEELKLALVSAYVWVASADAGVSMVEYAKFQKVIVESPFATQIVSEDMQDVRHCFKDMVSLFEADFEKSIEITKQRLAAYQDQPIMAEEIIRLSRAALVADGELQATEEIVLNEITKLVNIS